MSVKKRVSRPKLDRTEPIRRWPHLLGMSPEAAQNDGDSPAAGRSLNAAVSRSVDLGYRVIDEYIRQGQRAAQRLNDRSYGAQAMTSDVQELALRVGQYTSEFAAIWFELIQAAVIGAAEHKNGAPRGTQAVRTSDATASSAPAPERLPAAAEPARVRIAITSPRPAEVSLDLRPELAARPVLVNALRALDPDKPRVSDVVFEPACNGDPPTLRLRVPADQPAGVYNAVMVDAETSRPVGTISLRITE